MKAPAPPSEHTEPELHLLLELGREDRRPVLVVLGSLVYHVLVFFLAIGIANLPGPAPLPAPKPLDVRNATHLVLPPPQLTQKEPNKGKVAKDLGVEDLVATQAAKPSRRIPFRPPPTEAPKPVPAAPPPILQPDVPQIQVKQVPPAIGVPDLPPPPPPKQEKPKLAFEKPGSYLGTVQGAAPIAPPKTGIEDAMRTARTGPTGLAVGDVGVDFERSPDLQGSSPKQASNLELISDPMGVDFKPYLIRVLTAVRRNWFAVIPESARFGRRGKVILQFSIDRSGKVPKLVIVNQSGTESLDRAAVAGVSASNPFPPLPNEFRGNEIRVQLAFFYNVPSR